MGIELPAELADIASATGARWPDGDEDALREQAGAWRTAAAELGTLAAEVEAAGGKVTEALSAAAGQGAHARLAGLLTPETGRFATVVREAEEAAGRLDQLAERIAAAKADMVGYLVEAAKNRDAVVAAVEAGHPFALAGLDTSLRGFAAKLGAISDELAGEGVFPDEPASSGDAAHGAADDGEQGSETAGSDDRTGSGSSVDEGTGPIRLPDVPTPPRGTPAASYGGFLSQGGFDDVPTPPSGISIPPAAGIPTPPSQTQLSGFAGAPGAHPVQGQFVPQHYGAQPFGGQHYQVPPIGQVPYGAPYAPVYPQAPAPVNWGPSAQPRYPLPGPIPEPVRPRAREAPVPVGSPRQERQSIVALFVVHMFPIGHLPVATDRPARQLPVPEGERACAPWLRFAPHDHPDSSDIDPGQALAWLRNGWRQPAPPPATVLPRPPASLTEGHDPPGGEPALSREEWDRRYLVQDGERPEYAWPPAERYPEGGLEAAEPVLLGEGTELDRFGTAHGRIFAADGTSFAERSLPSAHLDAGYRRYRVLRQVPVWKAVSAAWFGSPGGGVRYRSVYSAAELVTLGYLADITFEERQ
ncbi:glycohydrolase toxin TNT-related protein [Saccharomonospora sp. NPDC006951]